jgi:hypothetical protein
MKSQVNALLHVSEGLHKDVRLAYPALKDSLSKDMVRLRLCCQSRGEGFYTLDLPNLESILLDGLEKGKLVLQGPLSTAVSKKVRVPRLYSGLWLLIFDKDACLKHEVDVNALFFLRCLLGIGKKVEGDCSYDRRQAKVQAYHDIESGLRSPTLRWENDSLGLERLIDVPGSRTKTRDDLRSATEDLYYGNRHSGGNHSCYLDYLYGASFNEEFHLDFLDSIRPSSRQLDSCMSVHLAQANDYLDPSTLPLFHSLRERDNNGVDTLVEDQRLLHQIQKVADLVVGKFYAFSAVGYSDQLFDSRGLSGFKHGPGAVAERKKNWEKSLFNVWSDKLEGSFPFDSCGKTAGDPRARPHNHEVASRLLSVPKTRKSPRLIAAESASHQWCQQLLWSFLRSEVSRLFGSSFIAFRDQKLSGDMVLKASLDRSKATVDLSDASDRLSCWTVERMFRMSPSLLSSLHAARTRYIRDEISEYPSFLSLRKFASQGTATTFPIMSLVMLFISLGSCLEGKVTWERILELRDQVRVYGDDIILPTHGYARLIRAMDLLQLKVNGAKSYIDGHFRESCGTDGYMGYDVTPVRPTRLVADGPASCQAVIDTSNNLFNKGLWYASSACTDLLPPRVKRGLRIVGYKEAGLSGLSSNCGSDERHLDKRWNSRLHRYEVRTWQTFVKPRKRPREGYTTLLEFFSRGYNPTQSRVVSEYVDTKQTKAGLRWEPAISDFSEAYRIPR